MSKIEEIFGAKVKPKEKIVALARELKKDKKLMKELVDFFEKAKDTEKGTCMAAITLVTKDDPKFIKENLDFIIKEINNKAPRVKWEASETVANAAKELGEKAEHAIDNLMINTKDEGTVVKWSTAYALTEIAKNNSKACKGLVSFFEEMIKKEKQNGVRNVYVKAMKVLEK